MAKVDAITVRGCASCRIEEPKTYIRKCAMCEGSLTRFERGREHVHGRFNVISAGRVHTTVQEETSGEEYEVFTTDLLKHLASQKASLGYLHLAETRKNKTAGWRPQKK